MLMLNQMFTSLIIKRNPSRKRTNGEESKSKAAIPINKKDMVISKSRSSLTMVTGLKGRAAGTTNTTSRARDNTIRTATISRAEMKNYDHINSIHIPIKLNYDHINTISSNQPSIFLPAFTLPTWQAFSVVKLSAKAASHIFLQLEREYFDWILANRTNIALPFLADVTSVEMLAQYFVIALQSRCLSAVVDIIQVFHAE